MQTRRCLKVLAVFTAISCRVLAGTDAFDAPADLRAQLIGRWAAEMTLPNGIKLRDVERFRPDGFGFGRIVTYYRDGTVKSSTSYSFGWEIRNGILLSDGFVRVPPRPELPDFSRDRIIRLNAAEMVLKDLGNNIVVSYVRLE